MCKYTYEYIYLEMYLLVSICVNIHVNSYMYKYRILAPKQRLAMTVGKVVIQPEAWILCQTWRGAAHPIVGCWCCYTAPCASDLDG